MSNKKKVVKKKVSSFVHPGMILQTFNIIDWSKVEVGTWCSFKYGKSNKSNFGRIQKYDGDVFICQNRVDYSSVSDTLGFKFSIAICGLKDSVLNQISNIESCGVSGLTLLEDKPKDFKYTEVLSIDGDTVKFSVGHINIGCKEISNELVRKITAKLKD